MEKKKMDEKQKKMILALPLLVLPFLTLLFWSLGGGKATATANKEKVQTGLNTHVPDAAQPGSDLNKLSLYQQADKDSAKLQQERSQDPNSMAAKQKEATPNGLATSLTGTGTGSHSPDADADRVTQRLNTLQQRLKEPAPAHSFGGSSRSSTDKDAAASASVDRLEKMMQQLQQGNGAGANSVSASGSTGTNTGGDPEMAQINSVLEKIADIQNPDIARQKAKAEELKNRGAVYAVQTASDDVKISLLGTGGNETALSLAALSDTQVQNGFYTDQPNSAGALPQENAIPATVAETQTLVSGAALKMQLTEDVVVKGNTVPKGTFVYGTCSVEGERLTIDVKSIRYGNSLYPVALNVYDLDGIAGIRVPGAISRDAAKQGADNALQSMQLMSMSTTWQAQAGAAGVEAAKGLFSKKIKLIKVTVKAGQPVLLVSRNQLSQY